MFSYGTTPFCLSFFISIHAPREGGDPCIRRHTSASSHFNPRPPRGGRPDFANAQYDVVDISIHAPREGGDTPLRDVPTVLGISIHAPREGGDCRAFRHCRRRRYFNPRPPRGGRPRSFSLVPSYRKFQSTPPARGATSQMPDAFIGSLRFQSTPPARGATPTPS